ncbi:MAG TPA: DUF308 domain-containing protein [Acidimicrobiales bacterium]
MTDFEAGYEYESPMPPPPPRPVGYEDVDTSRWWLTALLGLALLVLGIWLLTNLFESVVVLAILVGASLIAGGVAEIAALGGRESVGWPAWVAGGLVIALGVAVLVWPDITLQALAILAGAALVVAGALRIVAALGHRGDEAGPLMLAVGGFSVVLGLVIMAWPDATVLVLAIILGIRAVVSGLVALGIGWQMWQLHRAAPA